MKTNKKESLVQQKLNDLCWKTPQNRILDLWELAHETPGGRDRFGFQTCSSTARKNFSQELDQLLATGGLTQEQITKPMILEAGAAVRQKLFAAARQEEPVPAAPFEKPETAPEKPGPTIPQKPKKPKKPKNPFQEAIKNLKKLGK